MPLLQTWQIRAISTWKLLPIDGSGQGWPWHVFGGTVSPLNCSFEWLLFLSFWFTDNHPWSTDYSSSHSLFLLWPYPAMLFFLCWDTWPPWIFCLGSGWQKQMGLFCSMPHVKNRKCKRSILKSTQEISWFYRLNGVIYNTHVNGILFYFFFLRFQFNCNLSPFFFLSPNSPIYIFLLSFWFHGLSFHAWVLYTYVYLHIHIYS